MQSVIQKIEDKYKKSQVVDVMPGDTVKVHQKIKEGTKERVQIFEGVVIRVSKKGSHTSTIAVRRIASGIGVEKTYLLNSPLVLKVEVTKRSKVRRNYLTYIRQRTGKSARLLGTNFDKESVNAIRDDVAEAEEAKLHEQAESRHEEQVELKAEEKAEEEAKAEEAIAKHEEVKQEVTQDKPAE